MRKLAIVLILLPIAAPSAAQDEPARVKQSAKWDSLAKQVIPKIIESSLDFGSAVKHYESVSCDIGIRITMNVSPRPMAATLRYAWADRDENGFLSQDEIEIETVHVSDRVIGTFVRGLVQSLKVETMNSTFSVFGKHDVTAKRKDDGYLLELKPIADSAWAREAAFEKIYLVVTGDYRVTHLQAKSFEGMRVDAEYSHSRFGGKWLRTGHRQRVNQPGGESSEETRTDTYENRGGQPVLSSIVIDQRITTGFNTVGMRQHYTIENWQGRKRERPMPAPGTVDYEKMFGETAGGGDDGPLIDGEPDQPVRPPRQDDGPLIEDLPAQPADENDGPLIEDQPAQPADEDDGPLIEDEPARPAQEDDGPLIEDAEPAPPQSADRQAQELAKQIIEKVDAGYYAWARRHAGRDFAGELVFRQQDKDYATFTVSPGELKFCRVIALNEHLEACATGIAFPWHLFIQGPLGRHKAIERTWTARSTQFGYELSAKDPTGREVDRVTLTADFRVRRRTAWVQIEEGGRLVRFDLDLDSRVLEGVRYLRKLRLRQFGEADALVLDRSYMFTYQQLEGSIFLKRIDVEFRKEEGILKASFAVRDVGFD